MNVESERSETVARTRLTWWSTLREDKVTLKSVVLSDLKLWQRRQNMSVFWPVMTCRSERASIFRIDVISMKQTASRSALHLPHTGFLLFPPKFWLTFTGHGIISQKLLLLRFIFWSCLVLEVLLCGLPHFYNKAWSSLSQSSRSTNHFRGPVAAVTRMQCA